MIRPRPEIRPPYGLENISPEDAQRIVKQALEGRNPDLKKLGEGLRDEIEARLRADGVPEWMISYLRAVQEIRARTRASALVHSLIQVDQLPDGALPIYDRDPDVAGLVTDSEDDDES